MRSVREGWLPGRENPADARVCIGDLPPLAVLSTVRSLVRGAESHTLVPRGLTILLEKRSSPSSGLLHVIAPCHHPAPSCSPLLHRSTAMPQPSVHSTLSDGTASQHRAVASSLASHRCSARQREQCRVRSVASTTAASSSESSLPRASMLHPCSVAAALRREVSAAHLSTQQHISAHNCTSQYTAAHLSTQQHISAHSSTASHFGGTVEASLPRRIIILAEQSLLHQLSPHL